MTIKTNITPNLLRELLEHNAETGKLVWRHRPKHFFAKSERGQEATCNAWNARYAGKPALSYEGVAGYYRGAVMGQSMLAHRVIWAMETGKWPCGELDHINGNTKDNRVVNLRGVSHTQNMQNSVKKGVHKFKGVTKHSESRWVSRINVAGKQIHLGSFRCQTAAALEYRRASVKFHGEYGRLA